MRTPKTYIIDLISIDGEPLGSYHEVAETLDKAITRVRANHRIAKPADEPARCKWTAYGNGRRGHKTFWGRVAQTP